MKTSMLLIAVLCATALSQTTLAGPKTRIGIYDSRAVAVAFGGSKAHEATLASVHKAYEEAKKEGNNQEMAKIKEQMRDLQKLRHKQAFSTAPIDDILKHIENRLPEIKKSEQVEAIISKWDEKALADYKSAEKIDITMKLVDEFHPNDRQRQSAIAIQKSKPISIKAAENMND